MTRRTFAAAILSALLLSTLAIVLVLDMPQSATAARASPAPVPAVHDEPALPLDFAIVSEQLTSEHRALEAAQLSASDGSRLKNLYLDCARETSVERMDVEQSVYCQAVADVLMHRHFNGNLDRLLGWWKQQPDNAGDGSNCWSPRFTLNRAQYLT